MDKHYVGASSAVPPEEVMAEIADKIRDSALRTLNAYWWHAEGVTMAITVQEIGGNYHVEFQDALGIPSST